jgi:hypothetical protein
MIYLLATGLAQANSSTVSGRSPKLRSFQSAVAHAKAKLVISRNVYVTTQRNTKPGSGTKADPFNCGGSTIAEQADKLTFLLTTFQPNYTVHYDAGTYYTYGWRYQQRQTAANRCKHFGAGIDKTIIKLTGAANSTEDGVVFASDHTIRTDGFELHDLTIDCDASKQPKWHDGAKRFVGAVGVHGSNMTISRIKVIHFGTRSRGTECFALNAFSYYLTGDFSNNIVEDCIITEPATGNLDGISGLAVGGAGDTGITATQSNNVARRNRILMDGNDALYSHGPFAQLVENNVIRGCSDGVYAEPPFGGPSLVVVRKNQFVDCMNGIKGDAHKGAIVDGFQIEDNTFTDCDVAISISAEDRKVHYKKIIIRRNRYRRNDNTRITSGVIGISATNKAIVTQNVLDNTVSKPIHTKVTISQIQGNKTSNGLSLD